MRIFQSSLYSLTWSVSKISKEVDSTHLTAMNETHDFLHKVATSPSGWYHQQRSINNILLGNLVTIFKSCSQHFNIVYGPGGWIQTLTTQQMSKYLRSSSQKLRTTNFLFKKRILHRTCITSIKGKCEQLIYASHTTYHTHMAIFSLPHFLIRPNKLS